MHDEGVPVIAIPKTMDNDVHGTDYCIGFSTAITRGVAVHPQPAHEHRLARAHRRGRAVRPLQRRDLADHGLPRRRRPGGHLGDPVRRRQARRAARRRQAGQPLELRDGDGVGGRHARRRRDGAVGRGGRVRPPQARRHRRADERADQGAHRRGHHLPAARLPDALGQPGLARPDGRDELRRDGGGPRARGRDGPDGGAPQRHLHRRADQRHPRGRAARRRRRALRRRRSTGRRCGTWPASRCSCIEFPWS